MAITAEQCRAARALLDWSQSDLGKVVGLKGDGVIRHFEKGRQSPSDEKLAAIQKALEKAGVEFIAENGGGPGVRLAKRTGKGRR